MRAHSSSMYLDVALMAAGGAMILLSIDVITGIILLAAGFGIHTIMGD